MNDLISRQAAIDAIYHHMPNKTMDECRAMLHDVPSAQPEQRWIPCSERLPKKGTRAVLLYSNEKISGGVYMGDRIWNVDYNDTDLSVYIIAWQPRPEPYKADANNL